MLALRALTCWRVATQTGSRVGGGPAPSTSPIPGLRKVEVVIAQHRLRQFSTSNRCPRNISKMHLIFDFDGTITQKDTIGVLSEYALAWQEERGQDLSARWENVLEAYSNDAKALKQSYSPVEEERTALDAEREFLAAQNEVDEDSLARVSASGVFAGIQHDEYFHFGQSAVRDGKVTIRPGFRELVAFAATQGWMVHVISINWSSAFIAGALHPFDPELIVTNDLSLDGTLQGPQSLGRKLTSPWDKLEAYKSVTSTTGDRIAYFGDSANDVECLLEGGVAVSDDGDSSLLRMLKRVGVQTPRLSAQTADATIVWVEDFEEFMKANNMDLASP